MTRDRSQTRTHRPAADAGRCRASSPASPAPSIGEVVAVASDRSSRGPACARSTTRCRSARPARRSRSRIEIVLGVATLIVPAYGARAIVAQPARPPPRRRGPDPRRAHRGRRRPRRPALRDRLRPGRGDRRVRRVLPRREQRTCPRRDVQVGPHLVEPHRAAPRVLVEHQAVRRRRGHRARVGALRRGRSPAPRPRVRAAPHARDRLRRRVPRHPDDHRDLPDRLRLPARRRRAVRDRT